MRTEDLHVETGRIDPLQRDEDAATRGRMGAREITAGRKQEGGSCASRVGRSAKAPCGA